MSSEFMRTPSTSKMQRRLLGRLGCLAWEKTWAIWISEAAHVGTLLYGRCLAMKSIIDKGGINGVENCGPADRYLIVR